MYKVVVAALLFLLLLMFWPLVYGGLHLVKSGHLEPVVIQELVIFLPMSFIGALAVIMPFLSAKYSDSLIAGLLGYFIASPLALLGTLFGGLVVNPWLASSVVGSLPLLVFTFIGYIIGEKVKKHQGMSMKHLLAS